MLVKTFCILIESIWASNHGRNDAKGRTGTAGSMKMDLIETKKTRRVFMRIPYRSFRSSSYTYVKYGLLNGECVVQLFIFYRVKRAGHFSICMEMGCVIGPLTFDSDTLTF